MSVVYFRLIAFLLLVIPLAGSAQILFDGANGLPPTQGWTYLAIGGTQTLTNNNSVLLNTSMNNSYQAGYSRTTGRLDRTNGFTLRFTSQLMAEAHANTNRAGFSLIVLADDRRGLELAFWTNNIFAQSDLPLFTHAEQANLPTTSLVDYALTFYATNYILTANGTNILSGPVRDYTAFAGLINPYSSTNFLFFGDDTTSASGAVILKNVILINAPQLVTLPDNLITWMGVSNQTYTVQSSSNLTTWVMEDVITSSSSQFVFTNSSNVSPRFFRVIYP